MGYNDLMPDVTKTVTTRELRASIADVIGRVRYGQERIGITNNGKLAAVVISVEDLEDLEAAEQYVDAYDVEQINKAHAEDDGTTYSFEEVFPEYTAKRSTQQAKTAA